MSRASRDYEQHMFSGSIPLSGIQTEKCTAERVERAITVLKDAGHDVAVPSNKTETE